jgi:uncharacterized protein (DUF169 family)
MQEKCRFFSGGVEIAAIFAAFLRRESPQNPPRANLVCGPRPRRPGMASKPPLEALEETLRTSARLTGRPVAVGFLEAPPAGMEKFTGSAPSGCSFWRLAAAGRSFYTVPADHFNCAVGAYTHSLPLSADRETETAETLEMMFRLGYVRPEEVPQIPRLRTPPAAVAYAPLGEASFAPDVVLFASQPASAMLLHEAAGRAGITAARTAFGRPTCMALPAALQAGSVLSLGCIGNRVYTGLGDDQLYFVVRAKDLARLAEALETIASANRALGEYARERRLALGTA